ncbi:RHS repeat domain-containing protein [Actinoplanes campanulatus]|nr:RHS repeat-associated core domain-containing protein [Actinoplanes capillaceus]
MPSQTLRAVLITSLLASSIGQLPLTVAAEAAAAKPQDVKGIEVTPVQAKPLPEYTADDRELTEADIPPDPTVAAKEQTVDLTQQGTARVQAGALAVSVEPVASARTLQGTAQQETAGVRKLKVSSLGRDATAALGVKGIAVRLARADGSNLGGKVRLTVGYQRVAGLFNNEALSRLRLVRLADGHPIPSTNDPRTGTVSATVEVAGAATASTFALTTAAEGENGDYSATSLTPASTWQVSQQNGAFAWSYPMNVPKPPGSFNPDLTLGYSSAAIDGRTSGNNTQGSWIGDGWSFDPGFIERTYRTCTDDEDEQNGQEPNSKDIHGGDQCWFDDNAAMSFNGSATQLVKVASSETDADDTTVLYRGKTDDGSRIEQIKGDIANGDDDKTYWRLTTVNGIQYYFGRGKTDGGSSDGASTNSTWTVPVYSNHPGEPGYNEKFAEARKTRAWRWNLDYAIDLNRNTVTYFYAKEQGAYAREGDEEKRTTYDRAGYLTKIEYGSRSNAAATARPVNRVLFDVADRCIGTCFTSAGKPIAKRFPDAPWDQYCDAAPCSVAQYAPTFWTAKRLASVRTQVYTGSGDSYTTVDSYALAHAYLQAGGNESTPMWLKSITHTGHVTTAGGPAVTDPPVVFNPNADVMPNRVNTPNGHSSLFRNRIQSITTESGGQIGITYSKPECDGITLPKPWANGKRCFPQYYGAEGEEATLDWFNKYVVTRVDVYDNTGGFEHQQTNYDYLDTPAWAYDNSQLTDPKKRTWGDFRGYGRVQIRTGTDTETQSRTEYRYFRGLNGDPQPDDEVLPPKGTPRSVQVTDSLGGTVTDHEALAGMLREQITYNGADWISGTLNNPAVQGPTATAGTLKAWRTHAGTERQRTKLANGSTRWTATTTKVNADHMISELHDAGDEAVADDDRCTRMEYARNETAWILDRVKRKLVDGADCTAGSKPATVISETRSYYDDKNNYGSAPTRGLAVRIDQLDHFDGNTPIFVTAVRTGYDELGRATQQTDALNNITRTDYTPASGGPVTETKVTNQLGHTVTNTLNPALGLAVKVTDVNGLVTESAFDGNGRLLKVWAPGRSRATYPNDPSVSYTYNLSKTASTSIVTKQLIAAGTKNYRTTIALYDGMLRLRQTQTQTLAGGRAITEAVYNSRGLVAWASNPYYDIDNSPPGTTLVTAVRRPEIPSLTTNVYDGAGRITDAIFTVNGDEAWRERTSYAGERTNVTPPRGGIPTTTITDAHGRLTDLRQYKDPAKLGSDDPATFERTTYQYTNRDQLKSVTGPGNNTWTYTYDQRGNKIATDDPDTGTSTSGYDTLGRLSWTKDARQKVVYFKYDELGRKTAIREGAEDGRVLAEWTYDTLAYGVAKPATATQYEYDATGNRAAYVTATTGYDTAGRPKGTSVTVPANDSGLCVSGETNPCTYTQTYGYRPNGVLEKVTTPAVAGLPAETVTTLFNTIGLPNGLIGKQIYAQEIVYNQFDALIGQNLGEHGNRVALTYGYDDATGRKTTFNAVPELKNDVYNLRYKYNEAGTIEAITDTPDGGQAAETQCFQYDALNRLTEAWSQATNTCASTPTSTVVAGPAAYWRSYAYDPAGNRKTETNQSANITRTYNYPPSAGVAGSKPHAVTSITGSGASTAVHQYAYDAGGNTLCRPTGTAANQCAADGTAGAGSQALLWNHENRLSSSTDATGTTTYTYDAGGSRLIRRDPGGATLYLPNGIEIRKPKNGNATGTRYYNHAGSTIAVRTPTTLTWLINDHQGTATATVSSDATLTVTRQRTTPFGENRGAKPASWPGEKGFVGGTRDNTGLTHLGAREYDPAIGRFISVDPIMDLANPQQWSAYSYANNSPISSSDPTGLLPQCSEEAPIRVCSGGGTKTPDDGGGGDDGGNSTDDNQASSTTTKTVLPRVEQEVKCFPEWFCEGWELLWDNVEANADEIVDIAVGTAEVAGGVSLVGAGVPLVAGGGVAIVGSGGTLLWGAAPAVALGVTGILTGGALTYDGATRLNNGFSNLRWESRAGKNKARTVAPKVDGRTAVDEGDFGHVQRRHYENGVERDEKAGVWQGDDEQVKNWIATAINRGTPKRNTVDKDTGLKRPGWVYTVDMGAGNVVGRRGSFYGGGETTIVEVVVDQGKLVTAYPG